MFFCCIIMIQLYICNAISFVGKEVAEEFNKFFTTVASNLVSKLPKCTNKYSGKHPHDFYIAKGVKKNAFKLTVVSEETVLKILNNLGASKATGTDQLPPRFDKDGASHIVEPITHIINLSIYTSTVPNDLKTARVVPIYKKGSKDTPGNYRPVSVLSVVSKVIRACHVW